MDLVAYLQIEDLSAIAKANDICVPRCRGYRLMKSEETINVNEAVDRYIQGTIIKNLVHAVPMFSYDACWYRYGNGKRFNELERKYLIETEYGYILNWDNLHGKNRKNAKFALKKATRDVTNNLNAWNKYAGKDGILYIHARIGGDNWEYYGGKELETKPWFLEKVDDYFDPTYCDIYAKIQ